jgi:S1 RNA binding domain protein
MELPKSRVGFVHRIGGVSGRATSMGGHRHVGGDVRVRRSRTDARGGTELPARQIQPEQVQPNVRGGERNSGLFEEKLRRFLEESRERQGDLKRNAEAKRGRARRR